METEYKITLYQRPNALPRNEKVVKDIYKIAKDLTSNWFTANVPDDIMRDLIMHDAFCLEKDGDISAFLVFTSRDGMLDITLLGTRPELQNRGLGSRLVEHFFNYARELGFKRVTVWTVPEDVKPAYAPTLRFYEKHGFKIVKRYTELWESGAILLEKILT